METFLSVTPEDLSNLGSDEAVSCFSQLLWAEASSIGIGKNLINIPSSITVSDGGIDATVGSVPISAGQGIINQGGNRYQIKTGGFSLNNNTDIENILFKDKTKVLKPRIKSCLDEGGFLAIVLFGYDNPDRIDDSVLKKFKEKLKNIDPKYENARIEIWRQNQIISYLQNFPSLRRQILKLDTIPFFSHEDWYNLNKDMQTKFIAGQKQQGFINKIRDEIRKQDGPVNIRIVGSPGSGKTKIAHEITTMYDLAPLVIYFESPKLLNDGNFIHRLLRDNNAHAILVVDECDIYEKRNLWNKISTVSPRVKLVTIYNELDDDIHTIELPELEEYEISKIISSYGVPKEEADKYSPACKPSPRLAHWLGQSLISDKRDFFSPSDIVSLYERFIANQSDLNSQTFKDRKTVLMWLSLFSKIGFESPYDIEAKTIAKKIELNNSSINWQRFLDVVEELRKLKVLQGHKTLYITPALLHIWLWREWWKLFGRHEFDINQFILVDGSTNPPTYLPYRLLEWFFDMFVYAAESPEALKIVQQLLGSTGPLNDGELLQTDIGARLFSALAKADPRSTLDLLNRTIGKWNKEKRLGFTTGRREVLWNLERIVRNSDNFKDASRIILLLAEAENEDIGNNATKVFSELFSVAPGRLARTLAASEIKLQLLEEILDSAQKEKRNIGLQACDAALESLHFTRFEYDLSKIFIINPENWQPGNREIEIYKKILEIICSRLDKMEDDERQKAVEIIISRARALTRFELLAVYIIEKLRMLIKKNYVDLEKIIVEIEIILHYDSKKLNSKIIKLWEDLKTEIHRDDFSFLMQRYVRMNIHTDNYDENGVMANKSQEKLKKLAEMVIKNNELLAKELDWLVTPIAKNAYWFGFELGKLDVNFKLLDTLLAAQLKEIPNKADIFLGGYFLAMFEQDVEKWDTTLDLMMKHPQLCNWVADITNRSGMTDKAGIRLMDLIDKGILKKSDFVIFIYNRRIKLLSESIFQEWMKILLTTPTRNDLVIAISLFFEYYTDKESTKSLPEALTLELICHDLLFEANNSQNRWMDDYCWTGIAKKFVEQFPEKTIILADKMLQNMGKDDNVLGGYHSQTLEILDLISDANPEMLWDSIKKYIGPPLDRRAYSILSWIRREYVETDHENILNKIPFEKLIMWIDIDKNKHAPHLARFVPKEITHEKRCATRDLLVKYGDDEEVRRHLHINFGNEFWTGSGVEHYEKKKEEITILRKNENNENVQKWLDEYIASLDETIEHMKETEEREF